MTDLLWIIRPVMACIVYRRVLFFLSSLFVYLLDGAPFKVCVVSLGVLLVFGLFFLRCVSVDSNFV